MEPLAEPDLPRPLPRPLSDPLRGNRRFLVFAVPTLGVAIGVGMLLPDVGRVRAAAAGVTVGPRPLGDTANSAVLAAWFTVQLCTLLLLPRLATNAIYLRSFRHDATTGALRTAAQEALGRAFRLSGIRDPRRRWPPLIRHLVGFLFLIRYAQPKFMNLEAGRDWKARLWRSLGEARCAVIDVRELTPFLREEIELAVRCLGFHRILFIGSDSKPADDWRQAVLTALGSPDVAPQRIQVASWAETATGRAAFRDRVRAFRDRLPADAPGPNAAAFPEGASPTDPGGDAVTGESWRPFWLASLIGVGVAGGLMWGRQLAPDAGLVWFLPVAIHLSLAFLLLTEYVAVCGSPRERLRLGATFVLAAAFSGLPVLADVAARAEGGRDGRGTASRLGVTNNLKQIGAALHDFRAADNRPPLRTDVEKTLVGDWVPTDADKKVAPFTRLTLNADGSCAVATDGGGTYPDSTYRVMDRRLVIGRKIPDVPGMPLSDEGKLVSVAGAELVIEWERRGTRIEVRYVRRK